MRPQLAFAVPIAALALSGCLAKTVVDVATLPVRAVGKGVDLVTTSQSEADKARGREIRRREERLAKLERQYRKENEDCRGGEQSACEDARRTYREIENLLPTVPVEPEY